MKTNPHMNKIFPPVLCALVHFALVGVLDNNILSLVDRLVTTTCLHNTFYEIATLICRMRTVLKNFRKGILHTVKDL
jgi:hypothetical protein